MYCILRSESVSSKSLPDLHASSLQPRLATSRDPSPFCIITSPFPLYQYSCPWPRGYHSMRPASVRKQNKPKGTAESQTQDIKERNIHQMHTPLPTLQHVPAPTLTHIPVTPSIRHRNPMLIKHKPTPPRPQPRPSNNPSQYPPPLATSSPSPTGPRSSPSPP